MAVRRLVGSSVGCLVLSAAAMLSATSAFAAPTPTVPAAVYPPSSTAVGFSTTDIRVGEDITVTAAGFQPLSDATVTTSVGGVAVGGKSPGSAASRISFGSFATKADSVGVVTATVRFDEPGAHTVTISGIDAAGAAFSVTSELTVAGAVGPVTSGPAPKPVQGVVEEESSNLLQYGALGTGALILVGLGVFAVKRRSAVKAAKPVQRTPIAPPTGPVPVNAGQPLDSHAYPQGHPSTMPGGLIPQPAQAAQAAQQQPVQQPTR